LKQKRKKERKGEVRLQAETRRKEERGKNKTASP